MNREILFRGKRYSNGEWVYGNLYIHTHNGLTYPMILQCKFSDVFESEFPLSFSVDEVFLVIPETVGQFTGLTDKNGVKIFEGDILKLHYFFENAGENLGIYEDENEIIVSIHFQELGLWYHGDSENNSGYLTWINGLHEESFKIIGNIHDNPKLIERPIVLANGQARIGRPPESALEIL